MLPLTLGFSGFLGAAHNRLQKFILIADCIFGKAFDFSENDLFQEIYPDIVRGSTGSAIFTVVRTVEILNIVVALVEVVWMQLADRSIILTGISPHRHRLF